jgi:hypothetical protein
VHRGGPDRAGATTAWVLVMGGRPDTAHSGATKGVYAALTPRSEGVPCDQHASVKAQHRGLSQLQSALKLLLKPSEMGL